MKTFLLLIILWFGQGQVISGQNHNGRDAQQQGTASPSPSTAEQPTDRAQHNQSNAREWLDPLVILNSLLFVAVLIQAGIYWKQLREMRKTLSVVARQADAAQTQAEASETSAKAAEISAMAAKQTAEVALKSFDTAERPELYFKRTQLYELEAGKHARAIFLVCNGGRISAYRILIQFNFCAPPRAIFDPDKVLPWVDAVLDRIDVIPPNAELTDRPYLPFQPTEAQLNGLRNGTLSLYIYGRMRYEDGYGREYKSSFYRQYNPREPLELMYASESVKTKEDHDAEAERQAQRK